MTHQLPPRGYVLLATLMLLALASLALLAVCRASLARSADARDAERELQRRWGSLSVARALPPRAEAVLAVAERDARAPVVTARKSIALSSMTIELVFGDESAKTNVNALLQRGRADATVAARQLLSGTGLAGRLVLHPERLIDGRVGTLGEIFSDVRPEELIEGRRPAAERFTPWGDGRVNAYRASPEVLTASLSPTLNVSDLTKLAAMRTEVPRPGLSTMFDRLELTAPQRQFAEAHLAGESTCHSLWLITTGPRRRAYQVTVYDAAEASPRRRTRTFQW